MNHDDDKPERNRTCPVCGYYLNWEDRYIAHHHSHTGRVFRHVLIKDSERPCDWKVWAGWGCYRRPEPEAPRAVRIQHGEVIYSMYAF